MVILARHCPLTGFLWATRGAHNPNLQVVIMHALHVCGQHSFGLPLRMNGMHKTQFDHARFDFLPRVIWSRMFQPSVKWNLCKSTVLEQKCFFHLDLRSSSPALCNLWLLLVLAIIRLRIAMGRRWTSWLLIYTVVFKCGVGGTQGKGETNTARGQAGTWTWGLPTSKLQCFKINVSFMYHLLQNHQTYSSRDDCLQESQ